MFYTLLVKLNRKQNSVVYSHTDVTETIIYLKDFFDRGS